MDVQCGLETIARGLSDAVIPRVGEVLWLNHQRGRVVRKVVHQHVQAGTFIPVGGGEWREVPAGWMRPTVVVHVGEEGEE